MTTSGTISMGTSAGMIAVSGNGLRKNKITSVSRTKTKETMQAKRMKADLLESADMFFPLFKY